MTVRASSAHGTGKKNKRQFWSTSVTSMWPVRTMEGWEPLREKLTHHQVVATWQGREGPSISVTEWNDASEQLPLDWKLLNLEGRRWTIHFLWGIRLSLADSRTACCPFPWWPSEPRLHEVKKEEYGWVQRVRARHFTFHLLSGCNCCFCLCLLLCGGCLVLLFVLVFFARGFLHGFRLGPIGLPLVHYRRLNDRQSLERTAWAQKKSGRLQMN